MPNSIMAFFKDAKEVAKQLDSCNYQENLSVKWAEDGSSVAIKKTKFNGITVTTTYRNPQFKELA